LRSSGTQYAASPGGFTHKPAGTSLSSAQINRATVKPGGVVYE
jgi:hypothetical protein